MSIIAAPRVLITAGPTHEPIDAVRYIGNRSSGRMGLALAWECTQRHRPTTLLLGPTCLQPPESSHLQTIRFRTTADLQALLHQHWPKHDVLFMAAAVADFRPQARCDGPATAESQRKIRRDSQPLRLDLEPTPDLLAELSTITTPQQIAIGFALEPGDQLLRSAQDKLARKRLDAIVANPLETMDSPEVTATIIFRDRAMQSAPPNLAKREFARWLMDVLETRYERLQARPGAGDRRLI